MKIYNFYTVLEEGRYKGKTVREVFDKDKSNIFKLIKKYGYSFSDDVLKSANITKIVRNREVKLEWPRHAPDKNAKKYRKDTKTLEQILDEFDDERVKIKGTDTVKEPATKKKKKTGTDSDMMTDDCYTPITTKSGRKLKSAVETDNNEYYMPVRTDLTSIDNC